MSLFDRIAKNAARVAQGEVLLPEETEAFLNDLNAMLEYSRDMVNLLNDAPFPTYPAVLETLKNGDPRSSATCLAILEWLERRAVLAANLEKANGVQVH